MISLQVRTGKGGGVSLGLIGGGGGGGGAIGAVLTEKGLHIWGACSSRLFFFDFF